MWESGRVNFQPVGPGHPGDRSISRYPGLAYFNEVGRGGHGPLLAPDGEGIYMNATRIVRAAAVQMCPVLYSREATVGKVARF